ncbi:MAG: SxtJ family membrane protein [Vicinamibacterales bacterium]
MQWSDVTKIPTPRVLRQFAGLSLVVFGGLAAWRVAQGRTDLVTWGLAALGLGLGVVGLAAPRAIRHVYQAWMIAAFPIGWLVSRVMLAALFFMVFTPIALVFRLLGRDTLHRRRPDAGSYWVTKPVVDDPRRYLRQF